MIPQFQNTNQIINEEKSSLAKNWFFTDKEITAKLTGKNYFKFFNMPVGSKFSWRWIANYIYCPFCGYLVLTDAQKQILDQLNIKLWKEQRNLVDRKINKDAFSLGIKQKMFVQGARLSIQNGEQVWDWPKAVGLPYSQFKAQAGNILEDLRVKTNLTGELAYKDLFNVTDSAGNLIAGEAVSIETRGTGTQMEYIISAESKVIIPENVLEKAFIFDDKIQYVTDATLYDNVNRKLTSVGLEKYKIKY